MYDFDGFERREMALQVNSMECAKNLHAVLAEKEKKCPDMEKIQKLKEETKRLYNEKVRLYSGDIELQQKLANEGFRR